MIRQMMAAEASNIAKLHISSCRLSPGLLPVLTKIYGFIKSSPLAQIFLSIEDNQLKGFLIATTDRQRLVSDIFSRHPHQIISLLLKDRDNFLKAAKLFKSTISRKGATAEILLIVSNNAAKESLIELTRTTLSEMAKKGASEAWVAIKANDPLKSVLEACDFTAPPQDIGTCVMSRKLIPDPNYMPGPFSFKDRLRCALRFEQLVVLPIYCLALIPFASFLAYQGQRMDQYFGIPKIMPEPWNYLLMAIMIIFAGIFLVYSYSFLILEGEGGPVPPFSAKTRRLVTTGPYAYVRHPSIDAKLLGVIGLGIGFNSWSFLLVIIPLLLCWSIFWNKSRQEADVINVFGEDYLRYMRETPMLFPRLRKRK